jgi:hypothetical protein
MHPCQISSHFSAEQKNRMGLFIRTIGVARGTVKIGLANLVYTSTLDLLVQHAVA